MIGPRASVNWVGLVCDASSATLLAARGTGRNATLVARRHVDFPPDELRQRDRIPELEQFVAEQHLAGCEAHIAFAGSGTILQRLTLPPLSARNRLRAARTHLMNYADGHELTIDVNLDPRGSRRESMRLLAAGVDCRLARACVRACCRAGLRVRAMTALASAFGPATDDGALVQLVLGERTTTIQLFGDGQLIASRDVLLGHRDFVQAYQRPILTDEGPVTLSPEEADELARKVGVPVGREDQIRPGVSATQLWPTLNPVLQRLVHEVEQSLTHAQWGEPQEAAISLFGVPVVPGLGEFLATELQLRGATASPGHTEADYLAALSGQHATGKPLDLRPPERRFGDRMTRPALAAGLCAMFIVLCNSFAPREAGAQVAGLRPLAERLRGQLARVEEERTSLRDDADELAMRLQSERRLTQALPAEVPTVGPLKTLFDSLPQNVELLEVHLQTGEPPAKLKALATYRGPVAASIVAARWARVLSDSVFFSGAKVTAVSGSGREGPAVIEIQATLNEGLMQCANG